MPLAENGMVMDTQQLSQMEPVLLTLQAHCYNEVPVNCSADHGYLVSMRSRQLIANDSTATSKLVWGVHENVSYP